MLEAFSISVRLGSREVLSNISLVLPSGALTVIIGPNGAGKSTLLKALSGERPPSTGTIALDGVDLQRISLLELAARRAVMPQATTLAFPFTALEVAFLGASVPGLAAPSDLAAAYEALRRAGLCGLESRLYAELSAGERQRVHFARALCQLTASHAPPETTTLLLDEPTSNLDLAHQMHLLSQARAQARSGRTVVAVLHDLNLAATWADQIVAMKAGRVLAVGNPRAVFRDDFLSEVYSCQISVNATPGNELPFVLPQTIELGATKRPEATPA